MLHVSNKLFISIFACIFCIIFSSTMATMDKANVTNGLLKDEETPISSWKSTIEPASFVYCLAHYLSVTLTVQCLTTIAAESLGVNTTLLEPSLCELAANMTAPVAAVEAEAARILSVFSLLNILPTLCATVLMGSYSDSRGRKVALIAPILGGLLRSTCTLGMIHWHLDTRFIYVAGLAEGIFGGQPIFNMACFSYIADVTHPSQRTWRMLVLTISQNLAITIAEISAGYIITYWGFEIAFLVVTITYVLCLMNICCIRETRKHSPDSVGYFSVTHFVRTFRPLVHKYTRTRWVIRCCVVVATLYAIVREMSPNT